MTRFCENCGKELPEEAQTCPNCGMPVPSADTLDVLDAAFAQLDRQQSLTPPEPGPEPETPPEPPPEEAPIPRKRGVHKGMLLLAAVLALMAVLTLVLARMSSEGGGLDGIAYLTGDFFRPMYRRDAKPETAAVPLSDQSAASVTLTADGSRIYYLHSNTLYCADPAGSNAQGQPPRKVASGVVDFKLLPDGGAVCVTGSSHDPCLYYYDGWETRFLANAGWSGYGVSKSGAYVYYNDFTGDVSALYLVPLEGGEPEKIIDAVDIVYLSDGAIIYAVDGGQAYILYAQIPGSERVCITDCYVGTIDISGEGGEVAVTYLAESASQSPVHNQTCLDICRYQNGETTVLATDAHLPLASSGNICVYGRPNLANAVEYYQNINGQEYPFPLEKGAAVYDMAVLNGTEAVLRVYTDKQMELRAYPIDGTIQPDCTVITNEFSGALYKALYNGQDAVYYFDSDDPSGYNANLIRYCNGEITTVARDASAVIVLEDGGTVFTLSATKAAFGVVKDGETIPIANGVWRDNIVILGENRVLYLLNATLYLWDGETSEKLEENVTRFCVPEGAKAPCHTYYYGYY